MRYIICQAAGAFEVGSGRGEMRRQHPEEEQGLQQDSEQIKSRQRVTAHGEVYTSAREVRAMCDLAATEAERPGSRVLEPACGNGNFLAEILSRRLKAAGKLHVLSQYEYEFQALLAASGLYGIDILRDNVAECRERLCRIWEEGAVRFCQGGASAGSLAAVRFIFAKNIVCGDALTMRCSDGGYLIFSEWNFQADGMVLRRDFRFTRPAGTQQDLADSDSDSDSAGTPMVADGQGFTPVLVREFAPVNYLKLPDTDRELCPGEKQG